MSEETKYPSMAELNAFLVLLIKRAVDNEGFCKVAVEQVDSVPDVASLPMICASSNPKYVEICLQECKRTDEECHPLFLFPTFAAVLHALFVQHAEGDGRVYFALEELSPTLEKSRRNAYDYLSTPIEDEPGFVQIAYREKTQ